MTYGVFQKKLKKVVEKVGYNKNAFSSHSLRRGGVLWAFKSGVPESLIQVQGDWTSEAYKRYLSFPIEVRVVVNMKMQQSILQRVEH